MLDEEDGSMVEIAVEVLVRGILVSMSCSPGSEENVGGHNSDGGQSTLKIVVVG